jgi:hypothetical protein
VQRQGVDPDLAKAIVYVENAQGHYFGGAWLAERLGLARSLFPMNINPVFGQNWRGPMPISAIRGTTFVPV